MPLRTLSYRHFALLTQREGVRLNSALDNRSDPVALARDITHVRAMRDDAAAQIAELKQKSRAHGAPSVEKLTRLAGRAALASQVLEALEPRATRWRQALDSVAAVKPAKKAAGPAPNNEDGLRALLKEAGTIVAQDAASLRDSCSLHGKLIDSGRGEKEEVENLEDLGRRIEAELSKGNLKPKRGTQSGSRR